MWCIGSKKIQSKHIIPIMLESRTSKQWYVEPFTGGANVLSAVTGDRIGNDANYYLIMLWCHLLYLGWVPPKDVTPELYSQVKANPKDFPEGLVGYLGLKNTAGWFGGYHKDHWDMYRDEIMAQVPLLRGVNFQNREYQDLDLPDSSLIYCDPPDSPEFDNATFFAWCRQQRRAGHTVYVSTYQAPADFKCVWTRDLTGIWKDKLYLVDKVIKPKRKPVRTPV